MTELQEYVTTGMLGSYQPERAVLQQAGTGVYTSFRDTVHRESEGHEIHERRMLIGGKSFHISSVFPAHPTATPTGKMLELIDPELKKDARNK